MMSQKKIDKVIKNYRSSIYAKGYIEGVRYAREQVVEFLEAHSAHGDILTIEEIIKELNYWSILDTEQLKGLADGEVASIYRMDQGEDLCQDCFGADLCIVCERVVRG
jgi:hypothetical protein